MFAGAFSLGVFKLAPWQMMLLVLTTLLSFEAIYLSIFIQMTVNRHAKELEEVSGDVEEIQENIEEISEDMDEIQEDIEGISEDEAEEHRKRQQAVTLETMTKDIQRLLSDLEQLKKGQ
jgi:biopolymer transport protein ExbB/TolQ